VNISSKIIVIYLLFVSSIYCNAQTIATDFTLTDIHGVTRNLYSEINAGKTVVLDFFITNCGTCQINTATLESIWQTYGYNGDSVWVWGIEMSRVSDSVVNAFQNQYNIAVAYNITYTPQYFVVCPAGFIKQVPILSVEQSVGDCPDLTDISGNNIILNDRWFVNDNSEIRILLQKEIFPARINIYSYSGEFIETKNAMNIIRISDLSPGLYFIRACSKNGKIRTGKFIKL